jgi:hypothetical protein
MRKSKQLKLPAYQVAALIKRWDRWTIDQMVNHLNGAKPSPKATVTDVRRFADRINGVLPEVCKPKNEVR